MLLFWSRFSFTFHCALRFSAVCDGQLFLWVWKELSYNVYKSCWKRKGKRRPPLLQGFVCWWSTSFGLFLFHFLSLYFHSFSLLDRNLVAGRPVQTLHLTSQDGFCLAFFSVFFLPDRRDSLFDCQTLAIQGAHLSFSNNNRKNIYIYFQLKLVLLFFFFICLPDAFKWLLFFGSQLFWVRSRRNDEGFLVVYPSITLTATITASWIPFSTLLRRHTFFVCQK